MKSLNNIFTKLLLPLIGGAIYATGFPMKQYPAQMLGTFIGIIFLLSNLSIFQKSRRHGSLSGDLVVIFFFGLGLSAAGYYWIPHLLEVFGNLKPPYNYLVSVIFPIAIVPHYILFAIIYKFSRKINFSVSKSFLANTVFKRNFLLAVILTLIEYYTPQQFNAHVGHPWITLAPNLGLVPFFGAPAFSFFTFWIAIGITSSIKQRRFDYFAYSFPVIFLIVNLLVPLKYTPHKEEDPKIHTVRLVQANVGNNLKIASETVPGYSRNQIYRIYRKLSLLPSSKKIDLIIWPETAFPAPMISDVIKNNPKYIPAVIQDVLHKSDTELFIGGYDEAISNNFNYFETQYNAVFHFNLSTNGTSNLKTVYRKTKLIPFGETLPFGHFNKYLQEYIQNVSFFAKGDEYKLFKLNDGTPFISAICYEILFSSLIRNYLNSVNESPRFLINVTNDSWYGDSSEPYQHLFLAHWRALEFNIPIIRMTNTGITSILYPDGSESKRLKLFQQKVLDIDLITSKRAPTIFQKFGMFAITAIWLAIFIILLMIPRKKRVSKL